MALTPKARTAGPQTTGAYRLRGPQPRGRGGWVNTGGHQVRLSELRGRAVLLDFWTGCCVNCLHVLDELHPLRERFGADLVVLGIHSPKFPHEAEHATALTAIARHAPDQPVLDDPDLTTWDAYLVRAWPTLVLLDADGRIAGQWTGEGHGDAITAAVSGVLAERDAAGTRPLPLPWADGPAGSDGPVASGAASRATSRATCGLVSPSRVVRSTGRAGTLLVTDPGSAALVEFDADARLELRRIGDGTPGLRDGGPGTARFDRPQGLVELPPAVASAVGYDVVVADTGSHALRGVRVSDGAVRTLAVGAGVRSPWDVAWWRGRVWVAMAGVHQLWTLDPVTGGVEVVAGTGREGLVDGPLLDVQFAQPSALAADPVRDVLWLVDAESSALRVVEDSRAGLVVRTVIGRGLFTLGHRDGAARSALLQHPLGVRLDPGPGSGPDHAGAVLVADTYNGAVRRYDPDTDSVLTLATGLAEPSDLLGVSRGEHLLVVQAAGPALTLVERFPQEIGVGTAVDGETCARAGAGTAPVVLAAGSVRLTVAFTPPRGEQLDVTGGPPSRMVVTATPPALLRSGAGSGDGLTRVLEFVAAVGDGVLHIGARAASCASSPPGTTRDATRGTTRDSTPGADHPACHLHRQEWQVPVVLAGSGAAELSLRLGAEPDRQPG